jgi:nucleotide-binding universal stress UspA family protein
MTVRTIVVGTDGSAGAERAVVWTTELAAQTGARVVLVHAFDPIGMLGSTPPPVDLPALAAELRERLASSWATPLAAAGVTFETELAEDRPIRALVRAADVHDADLVVVGARGLSTVKGIVLGSTSDRLAHHTRRPVCIVHLD